MWVPARYSDLSGAISSSPHRTQPIPNVERRMEAIVTIVTPRNPSPTDVKVAPRSIQRRVFFSGSRQNSLPHCITKDQREQKLCKKHFTIVRRMECRIGGGHLCCTATVKGCMVASASLAAGHLLHDRQPHLSTQFVMSDGRQIRLTPTERYLLKKPVAPQLAQSALKDRPSSRIIVR